MITPKMLKYLEEYSKKPKKRVTVQHCVYMNRVQKRIDRELNMALRLAKEYPKVFLDTDYWANAYGHFYNVKTHTRKREERIRKLLLLAKCLTNNADAELVKSHD